MNQIKMAEELSSEFAGSFNFMKITIPF